MYRLRAVKNTLETGNQIGNVEIIINFENFIMLTQCLGLGSSRAIILVGVIGMHLLNLGYDKYTINEDLFLLSYFFLHRAYL